MLKTDLYAEERPGYSALKIAYDQINTFIYEHKEFVTFVAEMEAVFALWERETDIYLRALGKDCHPKEVIAEISEKILNVYWVTNYFDNYNVSTPTCYWNEVMQDDIYIISCDGWKAETYRVRQENSNKKLVDKGWTCDLVPKEQ